MNASPMQHARRALQPHLPLQGLALAVLAALLTAACVSDSSKRQKTIESLDRVLAGDQRSPQNRARDVWRHPKETLLFFGVRPQMQVMEVWPDPDGWYTEVIAPLVRDEGRYYAAVIEANPASPNIMRRLADYRQKLAEHPAVYDKVEVVPLPTDGRDIVPPGSLDMVLTFRNVHNWLARNTAPQVFAAFYRALKPGGVLGVVEHRGNPSVPQDPRAKSGYVGEQFAIDLIQAQGFRLVAKSQINSNPNDTKDYEQGVWTLPPTYRLGSKDHDKYAAIGESDRFTLKFVKPSR